MNTEFEGKSAAYIQGAMKARAEMATKYGIAWPAGKAPKPSPATRPSAAVTMRQDVQTGQYREDAADAAARPMAPSAARAKSRMLQTQCGVRQDAADWKAGLVDATERERHDAAIIARTEQQHAEQRHQLACKLASAGVRMDGGDDFRKTAAYARQRMIVRQDLAAFERPADPSNAMRADHSDAAPLTSAAQSRQRLHARRG